MDKDQKVLEIGVPRNGTKSGLVNLEDIDRLRGAPPKVWVWLRRLFFNGELEMLSRALVDTGVVGQGSEVPEFLWHEVCEHSATGDHSISFGDLQRMNHLGLRDFLRDHLGLRDQAEEPSELGMYRNLGRISHRFAEWLYRTDFEIASSGQAAARLEQLPLFDRGTKMPSAKVVDPSLLFEIEPIRSPRSNRNSFDKDFLGRVRKELKAISLALESLDSYAKFYSRQWDEVARFRNTIEENFPVQAKALSGASRGVLGDALSLFSIAGWVSLLERRLGPERNTIALTEIPVLPRDFEVWAGRIDRLDVTSKNPGEFRGLRREYFHSALDFIERMWMFRRDAKFQVVDYKFTVGDNRDHLINDPQTLPFRGHVDQVQWYLLWLALGHALATGGDGHELPNGEMFTGKLVYILPNGKLVDIPVSPAPGDLKSRFVEQVVYHWKTICGKRDHRVFGNQTRRVLKNHLSSNGGNGGNGNGKSGNGHPAGDSSVGLPVQVPLPDVDLSRRPVSDLVRSHQREFADPRRIVEVLRVRNGEDEVVRYCLDLDRLVKEFEDDNSPLRVSDRFDWESGGFITCPVHQEDTPSCHLNLRKGYFRCHGVSCGVGGKLVNIPAELVAIVGSERSAESYASRAERLTAKLVIPDENRKVARMVQELLRAGFRGSEAERYLKIARRIDPDLAYEFGAGCGVDPKRGITVVAELISAGYTVEQLLGFGILNFKDYAKPYGQVPRLLRRLGVPESDLWRKRKVRPKLKVEGKIAPAREVIEWVSCPLLGRLTFPLELPFGSEAVVTSFTCRRIPPESEWYGRKTAPDSDAKKNGSPYITVAIGDVRKGMFNGRGVSSEIAAGGLDRIYLAEAAIDALVLHQIGNYPSAAIIGTDTAHLFELLVGLDPSSVQLALDFDDPGIEATKSLVTRMTNLKYPAEKIFDFAGDFMANHPEVKANGYDDFGTWWQKFGHLHPESY